MTRILIVEDELEIAQTIADVLTDEGFEAEICTDGEAALAALGRRLPDLLVCDVMMPRLDGIELLRRLRGAPTGEELPVLLMSAVEPRVSRAEGRWDAFLQKPFKLDELLVTIEHLLAPRRRARRG